MVVAVGNRHTSTSHSVFYTLYASIPIHVGKEHDLATSGGVGVGLLAIGPRILSRDKQGTAPEHPASQGCPRGLNLNALSMERSICKGSTQSHSLQRHNGDHSHRHLPPAAVATKTIQAAVTHSLSSGRGAVFQVPLHCQHQFNQSTRCPCPPPGTKPGQIRAQDHADSTVRLQPLSLTSDNASLGGRGESTR